MNRIEARFSTLRDEGQKGMIVYIGAGDPDLASTRDLALAFDKAGVDILELGVPFSDPLADGLVNQLAAQRGLESGATPPKVLQTVAEIRRSSSIPIVLYIYYNLIHRQGLETFVKAAANAGVDGILALDLPPEEAETYERRMGEAGLSNIYLVAPTTPEQRMRYIAERARGFIYYVSREGVTGMQTAVANSIGDMTRRIRAVTSLPIAIGFGISTPEQAASVAAHGDGVVVGSAVVHRIAQLGKSPEMVREVAAFVRSLNEAVKNTQAGVAV